MKADGLNKRDFRSWRQSYAASLQPAIGRAQPFNARGLATRRASQRRDPQPLDHISGLSSACPAARRLGPSRPSSLENMATSSTSLCRPRSRRSRLNAARPARPCPSGCAHPAEVRWGRKRRCSARKPSSAKPLLDGRRAGTIIASVPSPVPSQTVRGRWHRETRRPRALRRRTAPAGRRLGHRLADLRQFRASRRRRET